MSVCLADWLSVPLSVHLMCIIQSVAVWLTVARPQPDYDAFLVRTLTQTAADQDAAISP